MATVLPHGDVDRAELDRRIAIAERFYAESGSVTRFQICPGACPADLDDVLAERGYRWGHPMSLQAACIDEIRAPAPVGLRLELDPAPTTAWFDAWYAVHGHGSDPDDERAMLGRVTQPSAYASVIDGDRIVAVGRATADAGWVGVFGMATLAEARGRGGRGSRRSGGAGRLGQVAGRRRSLSAGRAGQRCGAPALRAGRFHRAERLPLPHCARLRVGPDHEGVT